LGGILLKEIQGNNKVNETKSFFVGKHLFLSLVIVLVVGLFFGFFGYMQLFNGSITGKSVLLAAPKNSSETASKGLPVELFVMSQCPYGIQAEQQIIPAIKSFGDKVDFKLHFIASKTSSGFTSLHGQTEVNEGIRQTCMMEYFPQEKFFDYLNCVNKDIKNVESKWKECAVKSGIEVQRIESCFANEGKKLFEKNIERTNELMIGSSPSYYIGNKPYKGGRSTQDITRAICSLVEADVCSTLPPETEVNLFVVNDFDCRECNAQGIITQLKAFFPKLNVKRIDYTSSEGKKMLDLFQAESLPFLYFDSTIKQHYNWNKFKLYVTENEGLYSLNYTGTKFFRRTEKPNHIDLFVMSQCPFGIRAEANLKEVKEAIPDLTFNIYFIADETQDGFSSLHGQTEVNEDIRQTCIMKYNREKLLDYLSCVNEDIKNVEGNWKACAIKNEIDVSVIENCFNSEEGKILLKENIKEGNFLGISSSPTFIVNGQILFNASSAEAIKEVLCSYNDLKGCEKTLSGSSSSNVVSGGCNT
jgi:glutaredoxin